MYLYESRNAMHCHPGRAHLVTLLDSFEHHGPNGTHTCLVLELLGPNAGYMVELLPENQPRKWGRRARYPPWIAKSMLRQTLLGLAYLHEMGIVHGDLQPGNLLFSLSSRGVKSLSGRDLSHDARLLQGTGPEDISEPVRRFDGKQDLWAPKYLSLNKPLAEFSEITSDFTLKLSDLCGGKLVISVVVEHFAQLRLTHMGRVIKRSFNLPSRRRFSPQPLFVLQN